MEEKEELEAKEMEKFEETTKPKAKMGVEVDDVPLTKESVLAIKQMVWISITLSWIVLTLISITLVCVLLRYWIYQAMAFITIGCLCSMYWFNWNKRIQEHLR